MLLNLPHTYNYPGEGSVHDREGSRGATGECLRGGWEGIDSMEWLRECEVTGWVGDKGVFLCSG